MVPGIDDTFCFFLGRLVLLQHDSIMTYRIHGTGIFTYILPVKNQLNV